MTFVSAQSQASTDGLTRLVLTWYARNADEAIAAGVTEALRDEVQKCILQDPEFRGMVAEAIKAAALSMPLEAISKAVKEAIREESNANRK